MRKQGCKKYLIVSVYELIDKVYKLIGRPIDNISTLVNNCDDKVWDIYAKGLTTTINQADSDLGKQLIMKYKPRSLAELAAWVAAIRPGFASLLDTFINRQEYSTGVKELDDILQDSYHFMMYQENIMSFLVWLGIEEKGTYDIIKKIAKKKFKESELLELKEQLRQGWIQNVGSEEHFESNWQVVQDAASYSFNASHALSVAIDSLYGAYLKSHYPLEYFTVALSMYKGDIKRTCNLTSELESFNISLKPIRFRKSGADYTMDKQQNAIYKGISSIKFLNEQVADDLYALRNKTYNSFFELLNDFTGNSKQRDILIKLNFFQEFGPSQTLLDMADLYDKWFGKKQIKLIDDNLDVVNMLSGFGKLTDKQLRIGDGIDLNMLSLISKNILLKDIPLHEQINTQLETLGYVDYTNDALSEKLYTPIDITVFPHSQGRPQLVLYRLKDGVLVSTRIKQSRLFMESPFKLGSILELDADSLKEEYKKKKNDQNKWVDSDQVEIILASYHVIT